MTQPICSHDKYCYDVSEDHWKRYSHPSRTSRTKSKFTNINRKKIICFFLNFCLVRLFHGTKCEYGGSIHTQGLQASPGGRLGPGVYLTTRKEALKVAEHRGHGDGVYCIEVEVDVGHMKTLKGNEGDRHGSWSSHYHTCKSHHPPWKGVVKYSFPEWCVKDPSRVKIVGVKQIGGTTTYNGNPQGKASLSDGTMKIQNENGSTVIHASGSAICKNHNGSTSCSINSSNTGGSFSIINEFYV
jgi:hypothetical protein